MVRCAVCGVRVVYGQFCRTLVDLYAVRVRAFVSLDGWMDGWMCVFVRSCVRVDAVSSDVMYAALPPSSFVPSFSFFHAFFSIFTLHGRACMCGCMDGWMGGYAYTCVWMDE